MQAVEVLKRVAAVGALGALVACGGGGSGESASTPQAVTVRFAAVAGGGNTPVACGTAISGLGTGGTSAQLADLRFYLTNIELVNNKGQAVPVTLTANEWQYTSTTLGSVVLIDLENKQGACATEGTEAMNAVVQGTVPAGT